MIKAVEDIKKLPVDQRAAELESLIAKLTKQIADLERTLSTAKDHDDIAKELRAEIKQIKEELQDANEELEIATEQTRILEKEKNTKETATIDIVTTLAAPTTVIERHFNLLFTGPKIIRFLTGAKRIIRYCRRCLRLN